MTEQQRTLEEQALAMEQLSLRLKQYEEEQEKAEVRGGGLQVAQGRL